jgi:hypothetical protein
MNTRPAFLSLLALILFLPGAGCRRSEPQAPSISPPLSAPSPETVLRVHWLGTSRLGIEASAYYFMRLWNLPESAALQKQTLDKLCSAPWRALYGEAQVTNVYRLLLRPLLDDIVRDESYFELRRPTNRPEELVFAVRFDEARGGLWETNLANVMNSLTGVWPVTSGRHGWTLQRAQQPNLIEMVRAGDWVVVGVAQDQNPLLRQIVERVQRDPDPFGARATTGPWLEADLDLGRVALVPAGAFIPSGNLPGISLTLTGDGGNVLTHAELNFPQPLPIDFEPWAIPTNRIREPLVGLTAIRGVQPALASWKAWNDLQIGAPPNQLWFWAPDGIPQQIFLGVPLPNAGDRVRSLSETLVQRGNPWLSLHALGTFEGSPDSNGAIWLGLPLISPFVRSVDEGRLVLGGLIPSVAPGTNTPAALYQRPSLAELLQDLSKGTNLVAYDWELTSPRIESCFYIGQALRAAFRGSQLPVELAGMDWLNAIRYRLGNCRTTVTRTGPNQLTIERKSNIGLTGAELNLVADWLESPQFPWGLYSSLTPQPH